jgi:branched-chain amino acid transport system substrate-binding protein
VDTIGTKDPIAVVKDLRTRTFNDAFARNGTLRSDNLMIHDMYLAQVKAPAQSKDPSDVYDILSTVAGKDAFPSLAESACSMVAKK